MAQKPKKGQKAKHVLTAYNIEVDVDLYGNFRYSANSIPDASSIRPHNGDTISWSVKLGGIPVPFQVEFPGFGPFGMAGRVVRSMFQRTAPLTIAVPKYYHGNLVFKYTVTIANGWSDDPDVEPVPSDGVDKTAGTQVISLSIDNNTGALVLDNLDATFVKGEVTWKWATAPLDDFTLTFKTPPTGWPPQTNSQSQRIALDLETPGLSQPYTIQTLHLGLSVDGKLTIS